MKRLAVLFALLPCAMFGALNGEWRATVDATDNTTHKKTKIGIYAKLSDNGGQLTGTAGTLGTMLPIANASISGTSLKFSVPEGSKPPAPPLRTSFALTESGPNLVGTVTLWTGETLQVTLTPVRP